MRSTRLAEDSKSHGGRLMSARAALDLVESHESCRTGPAASGAKTSFEAENGRCSYQV
jgi:hypothetical protein